MQLSRYVCLSGFVGATLSIAMNSGRECTPPYMPYAAEPFDITLQHEFSWTKGGALAFRRFPFQSQNTFEWVF